MASACGSVLAEEGAVVELLAEDVELVADAPVVDAVADADDEAADERGVHLHPEADLLPRPLREGALELLRLVVAERAGRPHGGLDEAEPGVAEGAVGADDGRQQVLPLLLEEEADEPQRELAEPPLEELPHDGLLLLARDDGALEEGHELARGVERLAERLHVVVGALDDALLLGLLVEREGVAAGDGVGHEVWRSKVEGRRSSARGPPTSRPVDLRLVLRQVRDEAVDELALAVVVEVLGEDLLGGTDGEVGHLRAELGEGLLLLALDLGAGLLPELRRLRLGLLELLGAAAVGLLAGGAEDGLRLALGLAAGRLVVGLHPAGLGERGLRAVDGLLDGLL